MIKGYVHICKEINYKIYATEKRDDQLGLLVAHIKLDHLHAEILVYEQGAVLIQSPEHSVKFDLRSGAAELELK
jgi:hypothetical protein